jgi:hypothetical protein
MIGYHKPIFVSRKKAAPCEAAPFLCQRFYQRQSEDELDRHLDDSVALLKRGLAEDRVILLQCGRIEAKTHVPSVERPQRMVQEVVPIEAELERPRLSDLEVLEKRQIGVEEARSVNGR